MHIVETASEYKTTAIARIVCSSTQSTCLAYTRLWIWVQTQKQKSESLDLGSQIQNQQVMCAFLLL